MDWSTKRKILYALSVTVVLSALTIFLSRDILFPTPTCVDHKQNGYESGIDCGGVCALRCTQEVNPLVVVWAKALSSRQNVYDLVAMVNNTNINNASHELGYTFTLYNKEGQVTTSLSGVTMAPLSGKFPIIIQNVPLEKAPHTVVATLKDGPHYTVSENPSSPTIKILRRRYESGAISRVYATIMNTKHSEINNLPVRVVLFDNQDNAYAVGQTMIERLPKEGSQEIVVTWSQSFSQAPVRIEIYPISSPFGTVEY